MGEIIDFQQEKLSRMSTGELILSVNRKLRRLDTNLHKVKVPEPKQTPGRSSWFGGVVFGVVVGMVIVSIANSTK